MYSTHDHTLFVTTAAIFSAPAVVAVPYWKGCPGCAAADENMAARELKTR